ncbi:MAG TPA: BREX-1 system adenine-specific DNA-methyltransferase PglX [Kineosporiaceae bacterium]|nr:BREX-1 system adenine-specific DNA-methyltransferase PglX [Kineosporiaceae bacterium]
MEAVPLKSFAAWARTALIREVTARIDVVLAPASPERVEQTKAVEALEKAVGAADGAAHGRAAVAERVAYAWFTSIIALRFLDTRGYTGVGVVSPEAGVEGGRPEILADAERGSFDSAVIGTDTRVTVTGLLNGACRSDDPQGEAYALLLADYCRYWNRFLPFVFEREDDFAELLVPANLLAGDCVLNRAVTVLTADVCRDVEVIGWLYQFYLSERKDEVFAGFRKNRKAGADEIPVATQLFTPSWIVRYLVENSLGRLWMLNRPSSCLADRMEYYIPPTGQGADFLIVSSPEELKVIDPACGSGHLLTYAFDLLYAIYEEEGYAPDEIPGLILANNLYGVEIDPRAGALAAFALTMKARDRQHLFFDKQIAPNVCVLDPIRFTPDEIDFLLTPGGDRCEEVAFWNQFEYADTRGSLIRPDPELTARLKRHLAQLDDDADRLGAAVVGWAERVVRQAEYLAPRYCVVVANPPYLGAAAFTPDLAEFARDAYPHSKADLFAMFIERSLALVRRQGLCAMVTMQSWMFLASFEAVRHRLLERARILHLLHLGSGAFDAIDGAVVSTAAFVVERSVDALRSGLYVDLTVGRSEADKVTRLREVLADLNLAYTVRPPEFLAVPRAPLTYALAERAVFARPSIGEVLGSGGRLKTHGNAKYVRFHWEVGARDERWRPFHNGGGQAAYYGNDEEVVDWSAAAVAEYERHGGLPKASTFERAGVSWSMVGSVDNSFRIREAGELFSSASPTLVGGRRRDVLAYCAALNTATMAALLQAINPTINNYVADVAALPQLSESSLVALAEIGESGLRLAQARAARKETSRLFQGIALTRSPGVLRELLTDELLAIREEEARELELRSSAEKVVAEDFGIAPRSTAVPGFRSGELTDRVRDVISYAVACMFGRYSLDEPGLILADQGATLQDYLVKVPNPTYLPDRDNVIPIVDGDWFEDDIAVRLRAFLRIAFGEQHFEENLRFVTESLGVKEIRDYFVRSFYRDHVQRYRKRPIYWLFSSPHGSFNALISMHRYTPSTVSTVLDGYLREFRVKLTAGLQQQERLAAGGGTQRQQAAAQREGARLRKVLLEIEDYEHGVLRPLASRRLVIRLDDGVRANYPKFGAALKRIPGLEAGDE